MKNYKLLLSALMLGATLFSCDGEQIRIEEVQRRANYIAYDSSAAIIARVITQANTKPYKVYVYNNDYATNTELLCDSFTMTSKTSIVIYSNGLKSPLFGDQIVIGNNLKIDLK